VRIGRRHRDPVQPPWLDPGIPQRHRAIEHRRVRTRVAQVGDEVPVPLELEPVFRLRLAQEGFQPGGDHPLRIGIEVPEIIAVAGAGWEP